ncbi:MAG: hypothetical protein IIC70_13185, partial [Acidobacteria bacterium]|nr:hypothetical protein [Acidobacteriota bacterium]
MGGEEAETALKNSQRYGGTPRAGQRAGNTGGRSSDWVLGGPLIVTFERGEVRLTPEGLIIYGDETRQEIQVPPGRDGRYGIVDEVYRALVADRP